MLLFTTGRLLRILTPSGRRGLALLALCSVLMAALELVGVAAVFPFMGLVLDGGKLPGSLSRLAALVPGSLVGLGLVILLTLTMSQGMLALCAWLSTRLATEENRRLATRLLRAYLRRPFSWHLSRHSAGLAREVMRVASVVETSVQPFLVILTRTASAFILVVVLMLVEPAGTLCTFGLLAGSLMLLLKLSSGRLEELSSREWAADAARVGNISDALRATAELQILGRTEEACGRLEARLGDLGRIRQERALCTELPRIALYTATFAVLLGLVLAELAWFPDPASQLPRLSVYVLAGLRLAPGLHQIFAAVVQLGHGRDVLDGLFEAFAELEDPPAASEEGRPPRLQLSRSIELRGVSFRYPGVEKSVLTDVDLSIPRHSSVGLVGPTGEGKTTLVTLLVGLQPAGSGSVEVDGVPLDPDTTSAWQRNIGFVPQEVFLVDDTVERNIAFFVADGEVDHRAVERAARLANAHDFITAMPSGYQTVVGERGVRLSGGQRQRIAIARALYHDPEVLVLDEATSSVDPETELALREALENLARRKTLIIVAHRLTTVKGCDRIFLVDSGGIRARGSYLELLESCTRFRRLAGLAEVS